MRENFFCFSPGSFAPRAQLAILMALGAVAGCSGDSGAGVELNPQLNLPPVVQYTGPPPASNDVQSFKLNLWDNISSNDRCGACHSVDGGQSPMFARSDDINLAYAEANGAVTLTSPQDSLMVTKVAGGHNCWLSSDTACADILTAWITNWAGDLASGGNREIELEAPPIRDPGQSRNFPDDSALFASTVYPLLVQHCADCHAAQSPVQQSPFFAEGPPTDQDAVDAAYEAAKAKINLDDPALSRFVLRLRDEFHNCWSSSCASDSDAMESAITAFAQSVPLTSVDPSLVTSKALTLYEGTIASGGNRYEASVVALYEFKTGQGLTAFDTSGVDPAMDLTLSGSVEWFGGWGLSFSGGKAQATTIASAKLHSLLTATGEYSIEAWVVPGNVVQENARIVSYSGGDTSRNFNLGQTMYNYDFFNRTSNSDGNGNPQLSTPDAAEILQASLQHVVATFDPVAGRRIYVNGMLVTDQDPSAAGNLTDWDSTFAFVLGNEVSSNGSWAGVVRLVAIHNRALTQSQILQNFEAGVGEKFFLLFSVEHLTNVPDSYIVFEASQFDSYAYLFRTPSFISLDGSAQPNGIDIEGIRIGINGAEADVGQSFTNLNEVVTSAAYSAQTGQLLSSLGAVLPLEKGPEFDEFFLSFDRIAAASFARPAPVVPPAPPPQDLPPAPLIGMRTFDEINATLASITGVDPLEPNVLGTFENVRQSLPATETAESFLASHQVAIAQLAIEYCNALIEDSVLRADLFPAFPFTSSVGIAFPGPGPTEDALIDPLLDRILGATAAPIATQPDRVVVKDELGELIHGIPLDPTRPGLAAGGGDETRTRAIAKSVCAAVLGSAAMLVQ
jgi:mono/diheme cytochrome c family protein